MKSQLFLIFIVIIVSCSNSDESNSSSNAVPVYNQAYQENFEEDKISDIIINAHNAYVLLDPQVSHPENIDSAKE